MRWRASDFEKERVIFLVALGLAVVFISVETQPVYATFSPTQISGLLVDVNPAGNLWQDAAHTTPATADSAPVGAVLYTTGAYLTSPSNSNRPVLRTNGSFPVLRFSSTGTGDELYSSTFSVDQPYYAVAVIKGGGQPQILFDATAADTNRVLMLRTANTFQWSAPTDVNGKVQATESSSETYRLTEFAASGTASYHRLAGFTTTGNETYNWHGLRIGRRLDGAFPGDFDLARLIIYSSIPSETELAELAAYLQETYDVARISWPAFSAGTPSWESAPTDGVLGYDSTTGDSYMEQDKTDGSYFRITGVDTSTRKTVAVISVEEGHDPGSSVGSFTGNEAMHAGVSIAYTDANNNIIGMISPAASVADEDALQLVKQVAGVETVLATAELAGLSIGTRYTLELERQGSAVTFTVKNNAGTTLGTLTATVSDTLGATSGTHGFATRYRVWDLTTDELTSTTVLTSNNNPSTFGSEVILTATISPSSATGTVTFKDGSTTIGTATLGHGSGSVATSSLSVGSHSLIAVYGGNSVYGTSTGSTLTQVVNAAASSSSSSSVATSGGGGGGRRGSPGRGGTALTLDELVTHPAGDTEGMSDDVPAVVRNLLQKMRERLVARIEQRIQEYPGAAFLLRRVLERMDERIEALLR
jgi:hypothetical protein